jgi:hypothetical protein
VFLFKMSSYDELYLILLLFVVEIVRVVARVGRPDFRPSYIEVFV